MDIQIEKLVKDYGKFRALNDINLHLGCGMFGLLGPNGAGKTTLMRILTTLLPPTGGHVTVGGIDLLRDPAGVRRNLGYLPQYFGFYKNLNAYDLLDYIGTMKGLAQPERKRQIDDLLQQVNLTNDAKRRVGGYSGGMRQRLGIAQALLGNPQFLVVDEPTAGLDPEERIRFRNVLARLSGERTVLLSTHIVGDIEASCVALAVINKGQLIFVGTPAELIACAQGFTWELTVSAVDWERVESRYQVVSSRALGSDLQMRVIAAENPLGQATLAQPTLEDGYMAVMTEVYSHA